MILLTGASGFIGKHLLPALVERYGEDNILVLTSKQIHCRHLLLHNNYNFENDFFVKSGYSDKINTIVHAGAFTPKNAKKINSWKHCNGNILSTDRLLNAELPSLRKIVYLSTLDVYKSDDIISEGTVIEPVSLYAHSKMYVEQMLGAWANTENKRCQILRIGHVYGPGEELYEKIIPVTMRKLMADEPLQLWGGGEELRSFIFAQDIVNAILNAVKLEESIGVVNLVGGQPVSILELVNKLIRISGKEPIIETFKSAGPKRNLVFDNSKMRKHLLSFETPLDEGLQKEWNYMKHIEK